MRRFFKIAGWTIAGIVVVGLLFFFLVLPRFVDGVFNRTINPGPYTVSAEAQALHDTLTVADLHADSLLFGRDLLERSSMGHVDIPRLDEGNVALQVFSAVTQSPWGLNIESNPADSDQILLIAVGFRWPIRTWFSNLERAVYQAQRLADMAQRSDNKFVIVRSRKDLQIFLERRKQEPGIVAGVLAIEGAHALEGDPANVDRLFDAGYRMMSGAHFFDNPMAGSAHGEHKGGLTEAGIDMLKRMEGMGMIFDLSHASTQQIDDALRLATKPVVVSHTGVRGTCDNNRNLTDDQLRRIAATGGLVGIGFWDVAVCGTDAAAIAKAIVYTVGLIGADHVALGSDYDGTVQVPFDASGMAVLTEALMQAGMSNGDIAKVMGGNQIRLLGELLPQ
ncbi:MAG: dipeptidase [Rhizobiaceae bacterium]